MITAISTRTEVKPVREEPDYGKFVVGPLESGYGTTLGNALRRVLLSSIEGAAITSVKIAGVLHEFSTIPGLIEDVTEILLNLKEVAVKVSKEALDQRSWVLKLSRRGEGEVTAADIECPPGVEIVNPEVHIATISEEEASLEMELTVEIGKGFVLPEMRETYRHIIGVIPVGAQFTPVRKVAYAVEPTRVGGRTDFERLTLEIWTNATITPRQALFEASQILRDYLDLFLTLGGEEEVRPRRLQAIQEVPDISLTELNLSGRVINPLLKGGIHTIRDLMTKTEDELLEIRHFGSNSLKELRERLAEMGLKLPGEPSSRVKEEPVEEELEAEEREIEEEEYSEEEAEE